MDKFKKLDQLIEQVLAERFNPVKGTADSFLDKIGINKSNRRSLSPTSTHVAPLKKLAQPTDEYTPEDIALGLASDNEKLKKSAAIIAKKATNKEFRDDISSAIGDLKSLTQEPETAAQATTGPATKSVDIESFSFPRPLADLSSATKGEFLGSQNALINSVFDQPNLEARLQKVSNVSSALNQPPEEVAKLGSRDLLQYTMVADLFDLFLNQVDQRSSGYLFETFLANLAGGEVQGGSNGIADFTTTGGQAGSAKLFQSWNGISQSHKGLTQAGDSIHYVIGIHGEKQEAKRVKIDLYYVVVTLEKANTDGSKDIIFSDADGNPKNTATFDKTSNIKISNSTNQSDYYVGSFVLGVGDENYKKKLNSLLADTNVKSESKEALQAMKNFFTSLYKAEEKTKQYTSQKEEGDLSNANEALKEYDAADNYLAELLRLLTPGKEVKGEKGQRQVTENKLSALDKLIEAVILEEYKKGNQ